MGDKIVRKPRPGPIAEHDKGKHKAPTEPVRQKEGGKERPGPVTEEPQSNG